MYSIGANIVPYHILGDAFEAGRYKMWGLARNPREVVGTGAWRIASYRVDQELS